MPHPSRLRRFVTHALLAAALCALAAPLVWHGYDLWQTRARVHALAGDMVHNKAALGYVYAHAGDQPAVVGALAKEAQTLPPDRAAEALRVAALSCAAACSPDHPEMNPQVARAAAGVLPRLDKFEDQLRLLLLLGNASLHAHAHSRSADTQAFDLALAKQAADTVADQLKARQSAQALRVIGAFERLDRTHPAVRAGEEAYLGYLENADDHSLLEMVSQLNQNGKWGLTAPVPAPDPLYNRWLCALAGVPGSDTRLMAISLMQARPQGGHFPVLEDALVTLTTQDPVPAVRLAALHAITEWVRPSGGTTVPALAKAIAAASHDADPAVAREAWIVRGLLPGGAGESAAAENLEAMPSTVAEAAFVALVRAAPNDEKLLARLIALQNAGDSLAISATWALSASGHPLAKQALAALLSAPAKDADTVRQLCQWRALLAGPPGPARAFLALPGIPAPLANAAAFAARRAPESLEAKDEGARLHRLAALEGLPPAGSTHAPPEQDMGLAYLALAKAERDTQRLIAHLRPLLTSQESIWRDEACLVAVERLDKTELTELARDLLATPTDEAKMSGAMLCGLGKVYPKRIQGGSAKFLIEHPEWTEVKLYAQSTTELAKLGLSTLDALNDNANRWSDAKSAQEKGVLFASQIGLALRGDRPMDVGGFLFDQRIPYSTVLLGMLRQDRAAALDMLLGDGVRVPFVPRQLLADWRFGEVVAHFLPNAGPNAAPRIADWGDIHLQNLQYEQLRTWWRLRRQSEVSGEP